MIKRTVRVFTLCLAATAAVLTAQTPAPARAGSASTVRPTRSGVVQGTVKDNSGGIIPGATVSLTDQNGATVTAQSKEDGTYTFRRVAPGTYTVSAEYKGLEQNGVVAVSVAPGAPAQGNIVMKPQSVKEEVTVAGDSTTQVSVDPTQNAAALVLRKEDLAALPDDPDDLQQDLQALAGPSAGPGGGQVYIDGFSSGRFPPKESIREIRINQNPFSSEYDKLGFGRIEIFTKPGSDKFHGTAFYSISDGIWNSRNPFLTVTPPFRAQRFGGNVSGPISKKASFFIDVESRQFEDNGILSAKVPDPANPGNFIDNTGFVPAPQHRTTVSPRVDWQLGENNTLSLRYSYEDNLRDLYGVYQFNLPDNGYRYDNSEHNFYITDTDILSPKVINEARFQYRHEFTGEIAVANTPQISVPQAFTTGGNTLGHTTESTDRYEFQNYTTVTKGTQNIKFGARIRGYILNAYTPTNFNGQFSFFSLADYAAGRPLQFRINAGNPALTVPQVDFGTFIQDDWRAAPNLTISAGLRWEGQTNINDWRDLAPRLGFAWSPGHGSSGRPKTVIRGGFGMFYMRFDDTDVLSAEQQNGINQQSYIVKNPDFYPIIPALGTLVAKQVRYQIDNDLRAPYLLQSAIGVDRQLFSKTTLSVNFTDTRGVHQFRTRDINAPYPEGFPNAGLRPYANDPLIGQTDIYNYESTGLLKQSQVMVRLNTQIGKRVSIFGAYIWSNAHSNTDGLTSLPVNQYDANAEWGLSSLNISNRMFLGGSIRGPLRLQFSPFVTARSGAPFTITTGGDNNGDTIINDRPGLASGPGEGIIATPYGYLDPNPKPGEPLLPRNFANGPGQVSVNLRASRTWAFGTTKFKGSVGGASARQDGGGRRFGGFGGDSGGGTEHRYNLTFSVSARNILNTVNYSTPAGAISSPFFLQSTAITGGYGAEQTPTNNRRLDLQLRFQF
jgi:hypothetical protein